MTTPESDATLVARARMGDRAATETLLRRHFRACYLVALGRVGNRSDAEDVCQDAFIKCLEHLGDCRDPHKFGPWLMRIVRTTAHNRADYLRVRSAESLDARPDLHSGVRTDAAVQLNELRRTLLAALSRLSEAERDVALLHDLEGWRHGEIAVRLELSEVMSRRILSDARRKLRKLLGDYATLEPDHD